MGIKTVHVDSHLRTLKYTWIKLLPDSKKIFVFGVSRIKDAVDTGTYAVAISAAARM